LDASREEGKIMSITIKYFDYFVKEFESLSDEMNYELNQSSDHFQKVHAQYCKLNDINNIVIAYDNENAIGCASMKKYDNISYEVKRVFIKPDYRRSGIAEKLMKEIEDRAKEKGVLSLILETGNQLTPAVKLYQKLNYKIIENYGQYKDIEKSICMKKILKKDT